MDLNQTTDHFLEALMNPKGTVGIVCVLLIFAGVFALRNMKPESPLAPYVLQILGLTFILPVVILITTIIQVDGQAIMGLLGTIVGYIFGTSRNAPAQPTPSEQKAIEKPNNQIHVTPKSGAPD